MAVTPIKSRSLAQPSPSAKRLKDLLGPDWQVAYGFMLPTILLMAGIIAVPFFLAFFLSFTNTHTLDELGPFVNIENYVKVWQDRFFRNSVWITVQYTFWSVVFKFLIGLSVAVLLHHLKRFANVVTGLLLLPWIMPEVVRATTWKGLLDPLYGAVNRLLVNLGLLERAIPFFGDVNTALESVILVNVWAGVPLVAIMLLAGLKGIDQELYEAAAIDGAGAWRRFLHITLPELRYVIIVATLLSTIWSFNDYAPIFVITRGGPLGTTTVYTIRVVEAANNFRFGVGVAMGMTLFPILGLFILLLSRYMVVGNRQREEKTASRFDLRGQLLKYLGWPVRRMSKISLTIFWLINDAVECIVENLGRWLSQPFLQTNREQADSPWPGLMRRVTTMVAAAVLIILFIFELAPFYWVVITSFKTTLQITTLTGVLWPDPWSLEQYDRLFGPGRNFIVWYGKTLVVSLVSPLISTFVGAFGAYGLARLRWRGSATLSSFVLVTYLMPGVLLLIPLLLIFQSVGLINSLWSLILAYPSFTLPFALWMMMGYYVAIPEELEAAG